jgi:thiol-disulfide isomerase/thioredoxin
MKGEPAALVHRKADGARRRLNSVGQAIQLRGDTTVGKPFDLQQARGRVVLVHFWATWSDTCVQDIKRLAELKDKYSDKFLPVGVNLDEDVGTANRFLQDNKISWPNFFQEGGLDSSLAVQFGISSVPTMLLVDPDGKVIDHNVNMVDLEEYLEKKLR